MKIEKTSTGLRIKEPTDTIKQKCLRYFSLVNPVREYFIYSGNDPDHKPIFGKEKDVIYITSGFLKINDREISQLKYSTIQSPVGKKISIEMNRQPRSDLQRDCIKKLTTSTSNKITVELKPGVGKTFIALYSISILGLKPLIIAPTKLLKNQWIDNFVECGIDKSDIATNIYDAPNKTFCVVTISSIENELRKDWHGLLKVMDEANFGIRVTDEAHLHLKGNLKFDAICNIKYNWYLSATLGRSDVSEDNILNRALLDADRFVGSRLYEEYKHSYINVYFQDVYYYPSSKLCFENFKYGSKGLIKATYYQMLIKYYDGKPLIRNIINITKRCRGLIDYGKMVLVIPLLSIIDMVVEEMKKDPFFNKYSFGSIDGSMSMATRKEVMDGDIILSTMQSIGTGVDIPGLSILINFDAFKSPITAEQCVGRLRRRKDDKDCYYVDVCDHVRQAKTIANWVHSRQSLLPYFPGVKTEMRRFPVIKS